MSHHKTLDAATNKRLFLLNNRINRDRVDTLTDDDLNLLAPNATHGSVSLRSFDLASEERERRSAAA